MQIWNAKFCHLLVSNVKEGSGSLFKWKTNCWVACHPWVHWWFRKTVFNCCMMISTEEAKYTGLNFVQQQVLYLILFKCACLCSIDLIYFCNNSSNYPVKGSRIFYVKLRLYCVKFIYEVEKLNIVKNAVDFKKLLSLKCQTVR